MVSKIDEIRTEVGCSSSMEALVSKIDDSMQALVLKIDESPLSYESIEPINGDDKNKLKK